MIKVKKAEEILARNKRLLDESQIDHWVIMPGADDTRYIEIVFITDALPISSSGLDFLVGQKIAQNHEVELTMWDFGRGEDEEIIKPVFKFACQGAKEIEPGIQKLSQARRELVEKIEKFAAYILSL